MQGLKKQKAGTQVGTGKDVQLNTHVTADKKANLEQHSQG